MQPNHGSHQRIRGHLRQHQDQRAHLHLRSPVYRDGKWSFCFPHRGPNGFRMLYVAEG